MALSGEEKKEIISRFQRKPSDTGSAHVQVATITSRISYLQEHFNVHKKDHHSRQGLMRLVGKRRRLLDYIKGQNIEEYRTLIEQLGIRK
jgi:small subunit ribosomal protein S15